MANDRFITNLSCTDCKNKNYQYAKGKKREKKLEIKKYCPACRKHTAHKETK